MSILPTIDALGTRWWIEIFDDISEAACTTVFDGSARLLETFEARYSRFKTDSYISRLNCERAISDPDAELRSLMFCGIDLWHRSNGLFNPMVGGRLVGNGYDTNYSFIPTDDEPLPIPAITEVLSITDKRISLATGIIDIGGYGKGYVIDLLAAYLQETHGIKYFLINGGGDMYATSDNGNQITIYLEHPTEQNTYMKETTIMNQGFAASSPHKRSWKHNNQSYSHIIQTNEHASSDIIPDATFIKAPTACTADAFATVALLIPENDFASFCISEKLAAAQYYLKECTLTTTPDF